MTVITTDRLVLRPLTRELCHSIAGGAPSGQSWADGYPTEGDLVVASIGLEAGDSLDPTTPWGPFQICLNDLDLTAIGGVGALYAPDDTGELELGYGIAESARGQGLASEAVVAFMNSLDGLGVSTVVAVIAPDNLPSQRLVERLGFTFDLLITTDQDGEMQRWTLPYRAVSI